MKTKFTAVDDRFVELEYDDTYGGEGTQYREFWVEDECVYENCEDGISRLVGETLSRTEGPGLMCSPAEPLINLIRRAYKKMRNGEKKRLGKSN